MVTPEAKRQAVNYLRERFGQSQRKLCKLIGLPLSSWYYNAKPDDNQQIRAKLRELAAERRRWGCRQMHEVLRREGILINHKRTERLYREEQLQIKIRRRKKTAAKLRVPLAYPDRINQRCSMDFMSDNLADGRKFRLLNILDVFTKESLAMVVDTSINSMRVRLVLDFLGWMRGLPEVISVDNGSEFTSKLLDKWAWENNVMLDVSRPGKPVDNVFIENWQNDYNNVRPHNSPGGLTPTEFAAQWQESSLSLVLQ